MLKLFGRTLIILGTALGIAVLFYRVVNAGWIPGTASRFPLGEGRRVESTLEGRSGLRAFPNLNRNTLLFRPEFDDRDFENRAFRAGRSITLGLAEVMRHLSLIALMVILVILTKSLIRLVQRVIPRRI